MGKRTGHEGVGDGVEHVGVHVGVDGPVSGGVVARGDEDGVALGDGERHDVDRRLLHVRLSSSFREFFDYFGRDRYAPRRPR